VEITASKAEVEEQERRKAAEEHRIKDEARRAEAMAQRSKDAVSRLQDEPGPGVDGAKTLALKLPNGQRVQRRFLASASLQEVFDFLDAGGHVGAESYTVCTTYPRRVLDRTRSGETLETLGFSAQEMLLVEVGAP